MDRLRALILTLTILSLIYIADNWPKPVKAVVKVDYCQVAGGFQPCAGLHYRLNI